MRLSIRDNNMQNNRPTTNFKFNKSVVKRSKKSGGEEETKHNKFSSNNVIII